MRLSKALIIIAVALMGYGYWGSFTSAGNRAYDEMDGFIPFYLLVAGAAGQTH